MIAASGSRYGGLGRAREGREPSSLRAARRHRVGPVKSYNSNGLWLREPEAVAEEALELRRRRQFTGLKLRLGREQASDDLATLDAVRTAVGEEMHLMVDFNQGLNLAEALHRCHMIDDYGLTWIEEPIVYDNLDGYARLAAELKTPLQIGENFYGPREMHKALQKRACDLVMPDFMRIGGVTGWMRAAAIAGAAGIPMSTHLYPRGRRARDARYRNSALARVAGLGRSNSPEALRAQGRASAYTRRAGNRTGMERGSGRGLSRLAWPKRLLSSSRESNCGLLLTLTAPELDFRFGSKAQRLVLSI